MALRTALPPHNAAVKALVDQLLKEDQEFAFNRRSAHRTPLVRPAVIHLAVDESVDGFTRNISPDGVGILLPVPLEEGLTCKIAVHCLRGENLMLLSELRWCAPFGRNWHLSGWRFLAQAR